jgi:hypothetical protein
MNDSIDQNVYEDLHARVNDGDDGKYGINHPLERLNSSRNQVVLAWDQDEPLLIHTDLKTCQQCGSKMRNKGGEKECRKKMCDKCGWSVVKNGFPALVKLDHGYPEPKDGTVDPHTGEIIPGYTQQIRWMNQLAHKHRRKTPDVSVRVGGGDNQHRLLGMGNIVDEKDLDGMTEKEVLEHMNGDPRYNAVFGLIALLAVALFIYRMVYSGANMSWVQIVIELCMALYLAPIYFILVIIMMTREGDSRDVSIFGRQENIVYRG